VTYGFGTLPSGGGGGGAIDSPVLAVADLGNGTGATATITLSDSGSVSNDVYTGSWGGGAENVTFTLENSRTGDGTVSLTLTTGFYWAYVVSSDGSSYSVSNLVYFRVSDATEAIHVQCAEAVQAAIQALALTGIDSDNVKVRKFPHFRKDMDTLPLVLVTTHLPVTTTPATNKKDDITYPVTISLFAQSDANQTSNQERMLLWRESIRKAFHQSRLTGVTSVWMCNIPQSQPFNEAWFIGGMKDQSPLTLNFISRELRS
jgi:hypothetical protein